MATFPCSASVTLAVWCLACSPQSAPEAAAPPQAEQARMARDTIEHVVPKRDFVGPMPARFEWTAATGVEDYVMTVENEVDVLLFEGTLRATSFDWPKDRKLDAGTYFWRVVGLSADGRRIADSGRAAFVVVEN